MMHSVRVLSASRLQGLIMLKKIRIKDLMVLNLIERSIFEL
jgi:hypothetical protein